MIQSVGPGKPLTVTQAVQAASRSTGVDFAYLMHTAVRESSLNPQAKSGSSSAAGLFQFVERTWLDMVKKYGEEAGVGSLAAAIKTDKSGRQIVSDPAKKAEILALRHDPKLSAFMAAKLTSESTGILEKKLGRKPNSKELYMAHFLGVGQASRLLTLKASDGSQPAAPYFTKAARANKSVFYDRSGNTRTINQVFDYLAKLHGPEYTPALSPSNTPDKNVEPSKTLVARVENLHHNLFLHNQPHKTQAHHRDYLRGSLAHGRPKQRPGFILSPEIVHALAELQELNRVRDAQRSSHHTRVAKRSDI